MNKNWLGIIGVIALVIILFWLIGGTRINCHESFWDKDRQVIEIDRE